MFKLSVCPSTGCALAERDGILFIYDEQSSTPVIFAIEDNEGSTMFVDDDGFPLTKQQLTSIENELECQIAIKH